MEVADKKKSLSTGIDRPTNFNNLLSSINSITENIRFINSIFRNLSGYIEIREIDQEGNVKKQWFNNLAALSEYRPPADKNVYYGVFTRKNKGSGKRWNLSTCQALWSDFDNMSLPEVENRIKKEGLPPASIYVNSGHGIHAYWLLREPVGQELEPVLKGLASITGADIKATDPTRIMRLPGTYNVKSDPVKCEVLEINNNVYSLTDISQHIDVSPGREFNGKGFEGKLIDTSRPCINSILEGVQEGQRNWALGRLTKYLQVVKGYPKNKANKIILQWNKRNKPSEKVQKVKKDFELYWGGDYKLLGCKISNTDIQEGLNIHCNKYECPLKGSLMEVELDNQTKYNNRLFNEFRSLTGNDLIVYGVLLSEPAGMDTTELKEKLYSRPKDKACMSRQTMSNSIDKLKSLRLIEVRKRIGRPTFCKVKLQGTYGKGYTLVSNGAIYGAIDGRITPGLFKLYVLLLKYAYGKNEIYPGVVTLAEKLGIKHFTVSKELENLEKAGYISREYNYNEKGVETLLIKLKV